MTIHLPRRWKVHMSLSRDRGVENAVFLLEIYRMYPYDRLFNYPLTPNMV